MDHPERIFGKYPVTLLQPGFWPTEPCALKRLPCRALSRVFKCPLRANLQISSELKLSKTAPVVAGQEPEDL